MEKFLKKSNWTDIIVSLLLFLFGVLAISRPEFVMSMISIILGLICIIIGILKAIDYFADGKSNNYLLAIAIAAVIVGIIIMFCSNIIASLFRIIIAIWIIYNGIINLQTTIIWKDYKSKIWLLTLLLAIATIIAGIYILINTGAVIQAVGIIVIIYSIINIVQDVIFIKMLDNDEK